ncbi:HlyD family secretion protein [Hungatella effluvii]|uniref:HlyD family secretion protein n=1 Tax=Hungatella effluvii TaxID=1096246 RepID=A0A2V3YFV4_9FIRM|nr:HlyD family efflux transporter periplasmic adaptor subunit [Hungatella effluvii]PXX57187.1 HlyD family secretion protein [Hungatella effluvii]
MERKKIRKWCRDGFLMFLGAMAVFTVLSRSLDSLTVPQVGTSYGKMGNVNYEIKGDGKFLASGITYLNPEEGLKVQSVGKTAGQKVEVGEVLFAYQLEGIQKKKEELALSIEKMKLEFSQSEVRSKQIPGISEETLAIQSLDAAKRALDFGYQDLEELRRESEEKLAKLKRDYNQSMTQSEEEMEEETRRQYRTAERAYDAAVAKKESAVKKAEREVTDCEEKLDRLEEEGASDEEIEKARKALDRANEDLEEVREEQSLNVEEAKAALNSAEEDYGDVSAGRRTAAEALKSSYESSVEAVETQIKAGEKSVRSLEEALSQAELAVSNARARDAVTAAENQKEQTASGLDRQVKQLDITKAEEQLKALEALEAASGEVTAPVSGVVTELAVVPGKTVTGDELVAIGDGRLKFEGTVDKKLGELITAGTKINLQYGESRRTYEAVVDSVDFLSEEEQAHFTASVQEDTGVLGATAAFSLNLTSQQYNQVIPIAGLRQESDGYYILVVKPQKTILGEELTAEKIPVELLEKSSTQAAVQGAFSNTDQLIVSSSRIIEAGDRVRISGE